jgi:hypothetical protein
VIGRGDKTRTAVCEFYTLTGFTVKILSKSLTLSDGEKPNVHFSRKLRKEKESMDA